MFSVGILPESGLDKGKERDRLTKEKEKLKKQLVQLESRLSNDAFVKNAPIEVVEQTRAQKPHFQQVSPIQLNRSISRHSYP